MATTATRTVTWNGSLAAGASVTITISATINGSATPGATISNQGMAHYDPDLNGTNDASALTDDPSAPGAADPTTFTVLGGAKVPALSPLALLLLSVCISAAAIVALRTS
ncbi:MAG: IPTL-CTERM sorting domain-containing protein [Acidobacteria bacterium]|nr:IPTL-CTERM sorting domain-containing protein [Acidobacteriota bacterium]